MESILNMEDQEPLLDTFDYVTLLLVIVASAVYLSYDKIVTKPKPQVVFNAGPNTASSAPSSDGNTFVDRMIREEKNVVVFYGSQTGTAEDFASRLSTEADLYGIKAIVCDLEDCDMADLERLSEIKNSAAVFCLATYGEGDPTDNAIDFFQWLKEDGDGVSLEGVCYSVFALGNSTYEHYQAVGQLADKVLKRLGATQIYQRGEGDDDKNIEEDFIKWKRGMFPALCHTFGMEVPKGIENAIAVRQFKITELEEIGTKRVYEGEMGRHKSIPFPRSFVPDSKNPQMLRVTTNRELFKDQTRSCKHVEIDISGTKIKYHAGDHVGIFPTNRKDLVEEMAKLLNITNLDAVFKIDATEANTSKRLPFPSPCTYRAALAHYLDINTSPKPHNLRSLAQHAVGDDKEFLLKLASESGADEYNQWVLKDCRTFAEVIQSLDTLKPPADLIIELLPRLQPRYYSISSSPKAHPDSIHVTAVVVDYDTPTGRHVKGVCTSYLQDLDCSDEYSLPEVPVFVRHSTFRLPASISTPIVMIGPGTGLAPFRGFLQDRESDMKKHEDGTTIGKSILFYGCRNRSEDYLYQSELEDFESAGVISNLQVAFSRETSQKVYVSHLMKALKEEIWGLLQQNGHIYVCGDARNMAKDIHSILHDLIVENGKMTSNDAEVFIKNLQNTGRYAQDVWS
eukprot:CFRG1060T1